MKKLTYLLLLVVAAHLVHSVAAQSRREHCVMFYNVENLFHPSDDSAVGDDDFTPEGVRRWNFYRYNQKIAAICKVILAVNGWEPPDAVCFSEIENREVLDDIIFHPLLLGQQYRPLHRDCPDFRGIDVGIIYRQDRLQCLDTAWLEIRDVDGALVRTREILAATFLVKITSDTVVIFANHWTSKYGGAMETEANRLLQARTLGKHIDSLLNTRMPDRNIDALPGAGTHHPRRVSVIAGGDLNDLSGSAPIQLLTDAFHLEEVQPGVTPATGSIPGYAYGASSITGSPTRLRSAFYRIHSITRDPSKSYGTYKYQGNWGSIDHVFVGGRLRAEDCRATVFQHPLLLEKDTKYTGEKPYRTYNGFSYHGGVSDHLPLLLHFVVPEDRDHVRDDV